VITLRVLSLLIAVSALTGVLFHDRHWNKHIMKNKGVSASASTGAGGGNDNNMVSADNTNGKGLDNWQIGLNSKNDGRVKPDVFRNKGDDVEDSASSKSENESLSDEMIKNNESLSRNDNSNNSMSANNSSSLDSKISDDALADLSSKNSIRDGVMGIVLNETKGMSVVSICMHYYYDRCNHYHDIVIQF
jgi:hypothetical protein